MNGAGNINEQVAELLLGASAKSLTAPKEFDLMEMPLEGVAAFWLSVKKTMDSKKRGDEFLLEEAKHTREPHVRFLLELAASSFSPTRCEELAQVRKKNILGELHRKYVLMAIGLLGIVSKENPQKVMVRFLSKFHIAPIFEKQVFEVAQLMLRNLDNAELNKTKFLNIDHKLKIEALIINLIFYCMLARRNGVEHLLGFQEYISSRYFKDGLMLIHDGFDYDFVKFRLNLVKKEILEATERKMDLSMQMMSAIKSGTPFNDLYLIAKAFLP
ncbi:hypothetical protein SAMN04488082_10180 [Desulfomicrobium apsheronum]|uniref:Uncharacterized protein n=1 Tax=Desulfomicrobium apsheronum TaxID=52560 RepID=A0A1I3MUY3_9BACT|nr:hypothetical protein [Desulfomicrobium apsheronum]MDY0226856.1 hypothetical protein [Desulfomicrobium apsheronum]SFJ00590.1 hypothetical protein SAMN04488082_10180 [Desulfomicrobium apsheronum]